MQTTRRSFVARALAALGASALPRPLTAAALESLPPIPQGGPLDEDFWRTFRRSFLLPPDEAFFNTGSLGPTPRPVLEAVTAHLTTLATSITHVNYQGEGPRIWGGYGPEPDLCGKLAALVNANASEIGLTSNATMAMNFVANGLDLAAGDEVIVVQYAHPGGRCGWELRGKRDQVRVVYVTVPYPVRDPSQLIALYEGATTARTRVWAIPHLTSGIGATLFPVRELCRLARDRGILSVVDGAQTLGHLVIDVRDMACDAYFASPHKWLLAPAGCGMLYLRNDVQPRIWTTLAGAQWDNQTDGMLRLMQWGATSYSILAGLHAAIDLHTSLGSRRVQDRVIALNQRLREGLDGIRGVTVHSPRHPDMMTGTSIWGVEGMTGVDLQEALWREARVRVRAAGDGTPPGVRQCCHICATMEEVDRSVAAARVIAGRVR
ncbi:MAG TPA: aminotransferase class V-fold PLP-dependent enzyme [Gemmatimonadaceae bacterium]|nr:aminotransferase class V-fold PLP-dependent enzyme [Gemmatimonadaceae bacterium]